MVEAVAADVVDVVVDENIEKLYEYVLYVKRIRVFNSPFFQSDRSCIMQYKDAKYNIRVIKNIGTWYRSFNNYPYALPFI